MRNIWESVLIMTVAVFIPGCVTMPPLPTTSFHLDQIDTSCLQGKVIVIDPGHGGKYRGAIGTTGLKESEVNLGVALHLWGLLKSAGAKPVMTRTADTTVVSSHGQRLSDDLLARSSMSNALNPDLFISIHHNANIHDTKKNNLEVYYKLTDPGPSKELAECIVTRMEKPFEVGKALVLPGYFSVLRETLSTAILGEASYLTHRENERRLSLHGFLRLEAEAYFLGILDYVKRGIPKVIDLSLNEGPRQAQPEVLAWVEDDMCGKGMDPDSIRLYLDGILVGHHYNPTTGKIHYIPEKPLTNREHTLLIEAKNLGGNSTKPAGRTFHVSLPPFRIETHPLTETLPPDGLSRTRIIAEVVDENLNPVANGTPVRFFTSAGRIVDSLAVTRRGKAITHLVADYQPGWADVVAICGGVLNSCMVAFAKPEERLVEICIHDKEGNPLEGAELMVEGEANLLTDHLGYCFYQEDSKKESAFTVWKDGYMPLQGFWDGPVEEVVREDLVLEPVDEKRMWHKVVVIDPQSEEETAALKSSQDIMREKTNLKTAFCLKEMLTLAGATVLLTRDGDDGPTPVERVMRANKTGANVLISIDHKKGSSSLGYYFSSRRGKVLARSIQYFIDRDLSCKKLRMTESTKFVIVHTSMPAVEINLARRRCKRLPDDEDDKAWAEAQVIYQGLRSYFSEVAGKTTLRRKNVNRF